MSYPPPVDAALVWLQSKNAHGAKYDLFLPVGRSAGPFKILTIAVGRKGCGADEEMCRYGSFVALVEFAEIEWAQMRL